MIILVAPKDIAVGLFGNFRYGEVAPGDLSASNDYSLHILIVLDDLVLHDLWFALCKKGFFVEAFAGRFLIIRAFFDHPFLHRSPIVHGVEVDLVLFQTFFKILVQVGVHIVVALSLDLRKFHRLSIFWHLGIEHHVVVIETEGEDLAFIIFAHGLH